ATALARARLHPMAGRGPQRVDGARDVLAQASLERHAALVGAAQPHVPLSLAVQDGELAQERGMLAQGSARGDLDVVDVLLGAVLVAIAAASPASLAVEAHADSFARTGSARWGNRTTSATGRSFTRSARPAEQSRAAAPTRKRACAEVRGCPRSVQATGKHLTRPPPAAEPIPAARPPAAASAPT